MNRPSPSSPSAEYVLVPREPSREVCAHIPALIALGPDDLPLRKLGWTMNEISNLKRWRMFLDALGCNQTSPVLTAAPQVEELLDPKTLTYVKAVRVSPTQPAETKGDLTYDEIAKRNRCEPEETKPRPASGESAPSPATGGKEAAE